MFRKSIAGSVLVIYCSCCTLDSLSDSVDVIYFSVLQYCGNFPFI